MALKQRLGILAAVGAVCGSGGLALAQVDLLPDITVRQSDLYDNDIVTQSGQRLLRLSNTTPNIGAGRLHLYGGTVNTDGTQDVVQRVFRNNGTFYDRVAGRFVYHAGHSHIHVEGWALYRLRQVLAGDGVGPIVAQGEKTSFCILDLSVHDSSLPGFNPSGQYRSCGTTTQGLSVGWQDTYGKTLEGQNINITGVAAGEYWLEAEVDPDNTMLESNEGNNITRVKVTIPPAGGGGTPLAPDAFEPNDSRAAVDARPVGQVNSPNLGPCNPELVITGLSISGNEDFFKFYLPATGTSSDFVRIDFTHSLGDVDMQLLNSTGGSVGSATGVTNVENISLSGRARGWYYVRVYGYNGATNPAYTLRINPSANTAPTINVLTPPAGNVVRQHSVETFDVTWSASDANGDPMWVTLSLNDTPTLDGTQITLPTSLHTPAAAGIHVINSAYLEPGRYYVYASITDGGTTSGSWSAGTVEFVEPCRADVNLSGGIPDIDDIIMFFGLFGEGDPRADMNDSEGIPDIDDIITFFDLFNAGC